MNGPPAEARPQRRCPAMQLQAESDRNFQQLDLAKKQIKIINPDRQQPRAFRNEYERVMKEIVALKAIAEGSQEVHHLIVAVMCALATAMLCKASSSLLLCDVLESYFHGTALTGAMGCSSILVDELASCGLQHPQLLFTCAAYLTTAPLDETDLNCRRPRLMQGLYLR